MRRLRHLLLAALACGGTAALAPAAAPEAATLSNGLLTLDVAETNGTFTAQLNGVDFFESGAFIADFGLQVGGTGATFRINTRAGLAAGLTTVGFDVLGPRSVQYRATYAPNAGTAINVVRRITLLDGLNAIRIDTRLGNGSGAPKTIRLFDTFDPDPSGTRSTFNEVATVEGAAAAVAGNGSGGVAVGGEGARTGFLRDDLGISTGGELNNFLTRPIFNPARAEADIGLATARSISLSRTGSATVSTVLAFGFGTLGPRDARAAFGFALAAP